VLAIAEEGGLLNAPDVYMEKLAVGPGYAEGVIDLNKSPTENVRAVAAAKGVDPSEIIVCVLDRPRHAELIAELRGSAAASTHPGRRRGGRDRGHQSGHHDRRLYGLGRRSGGRAGGGGSCSPPACSSRAIRGSGKSHLLRRLLEGSAGLVQQIVIDPEGDFVSLARCSATSRSRRADSTSRDRRMAARVREHRASVVLSLEGLELEAQMRCAAAFLSALFDAPREHWYPALVVVDEAQVFAPAAAGEVSDEARRASLGAMTNLMCRGRKRGLAGIIATQRLAKLAKNVAAEASNFLMGRTFLDIDMARAADLLGMERRRPKRSATCSAASSWRSAPPLSRRPINIRIGEVQTRRAAPAPSSCRCQLRRKPLRRLGPGAPGSSPGALHPQHAGLPGPPSGPRARRSVAQQEGQHIIAVHALLGGRVDFDPVAEAEQALGAGSLPDERIERHQQRPPLGSGAAASHRGADRPAAPALDLHRQQHPLLDQLRDARRRVGLQAEIVAQVPRGGEPVRPRALSPAARCASSLGRRRQIEDAGRDHPLGQVVDPLEAVAPRGGGDPSR
jgi:hypothetical protein